MLESGLGWGIKVISEKNESVPGAKELAIEVLKQAAEMALSEGKPDGYTIGLNAWEMLHTMA